MLTSKLETGICFFIWGIDPKNKEEIFYEIASLWIGSGEGSASQRGGHATPLKGFCDA